MLYRLDSEADPLQFVQPIDKCPNEPEFVSLTFREGRCVEINHVEVTPLQAMRMANELGRRHGLGVSVTTDGTSLKRCESPGLFLLARALKFIYDETLDKGSRDIFRSYATHISDQMKKGSFADVSTKSALIAIKFLASTANGSVSLELHKGDAIFLHTSASSLRPNAVGAGEEVFTPGDGSFTDFQW